VNTQKYYFEKLYDCMLRIKNFLALYEQAYGWLSLSVQYVRYILICSIAGSYSKGLSAPWNC